MQNNNNNKISLQYVQAQCEALRAVGLHKEAMEKEAFWGALVRGALGVGQRIIGSGVKAAGRFFNSAKATQAGGNLAAKGLKNAPTSMVGKMTPKRMGIKTLNYARKNPINAGVTGLMGAQALWPSGAPQVAQQQVAKFYNPNQFRPM